MIVILSSSFDSIHSDSVLNKITKLVGDYGVTTIEVDKLVKDRTIDISFGSGVTKTLLGKNIEAKNVTAVWVRKLFWFGLNGESSEITKTNNDIRILVTSILKIWKEQNPNIKWISDPDSLQFAFNKPYQLYCARESGLAVLPTNISLSAGTASSSSVFENVTAIIHKRLRGDTHAAEDGTVYEFPTRLIDDAFIEAHAKTLPLPFIFQEALILKEEYRVVYVEGKFFCTRTTPLPGKDVRKNSVDWRLLSIRKDELVLETEVFTLPLKIQNCIKRFMRKLHLSYGAIDMISDPKTGEFYFLEVNPVGQWLYYELKYGLPISDAIAEALTNTKKK